MTFGSTSPFTVEGSPIDLRADQRYDNPWMQVPFDATTATITAGDRTLVHDYSAWTRTAG